MVFVVSESMINITGGFLNIGIFVLIENVYFEKLLNLSFGFKERFTKICSAATTSGSEKLNYVKVKRREVGRHLGAQAVPLKEMAL